MLFRFAPFTPTVRLMQDGGDKRNAASPRDRVFALSADSAAASASDPAVTSAPASASADVLFECDFRYGGIQWGDDRLALAYESWYDTRTQRIWALAPGAAIGSGIGRGGAVGVPSKRILRERDWEDAYGDPGSPMTRRMADGSYVLAIIEPDGSADVAEAAGGAAGERPGRRLLLEGAGAGPEGYRPFIDVADADSGRQVCWTFLLIPSICGFPVFRVRSPAL